jgi:hypothetical protein
MNGILHFRGRRHSAELMALISSNGQAATLQIQDLLDIPSYHLLILFRNWY